MLNTLQSYRHSVYLKDIIISRVFVLYFQYKIVGLCAMAYTVCTYKHDNFKAVVCEEKYKVICLFLSNSTNTENRIG